jgi:hypothetical protein
MTEYDDAPSGPVPQDERHSTPVVTSGDSQVRTVSMVDAGTAIQRVSVPAQVGQQRVSSQESSLITLASGSDIEYFHNSRKEAYVTFPVGSHRETFPVASKRFKLWLAQRHFEKARWTPNLKKLQEALNQLEAISLFYGPERPIFTRVAELDGTIYVDLANDDWSVVAINSEGWSVIPGSPV